MPIRVRAATAADGVALGRMGSALARLHHEFDARRFFLVSQIEEGYRDWLVREIGNPQAMVRVAEVEGRVVGYVYATLEARDWNKLLDAHAALVDVWVDEKARRSGAAIALVRAVLEEAAACGAKRAVLMSAARNVGAQALFAKLGFRSTMVEMTRELE